MAIALRAVASTAYADATSTTCNKPTGTVDGDIMIMTVFGGRSDNQANNVWTTVPPGWTQIGTTSLINDTGNSFFVKFYIYWKRASSEGASYTFSSGNSIATQISILSYSGCLASGSPVDVSSINSAQTGTTATATGVTTTVANTMLVYTGHNWDGSGTLTPPSGMTERFDGLIYQADEARATAAATGNRTQTVASSAPWHAALVALKPAGATAYTLAAAAGSYAMTGAAATPKHGWKPAAANGSYAMTGTAATPTKLSPKTLAATGGAYAMLGAAAATKHGWKPVAAASSYAMTGTAAVPKRGFAAAALAGSYAMTGVAAAQNRTWRPTALAGSYAMLGTAALPTKVSAAAAFRSLASTSYTDRIGSTTVSLPVGTTDGDVMVMALVGGRASPASEIVIDSFPPGWTQIGTTVTSTEISGVFSLKMWVFWKRASGEASTYTFTHTNSIATQAVIASYSGCLSTGTPLDAFSQNAQTVADDTAVALSVTTSASNDKLIFLAHNWDGSQTLSPPSGMTERFDSIVYLSDQDAVSVGSTGNFVQTPLASSGPWQAYLLAFKPGRTSIPLAPPPFNPAVFLPFLVR